MFTFTEKQGRRLGGQPRQGATAVPLIATTTVRLEPQQLEDLLHGDFRAQAVKVDTRHAGSSQDTGAIWK